MTKKTKAERGFGQEGGGEGRKRGKGEEREGGVGPGGKMAKLIPIRIPILGKV